MTEMKNENDEMIMATSRARVALLTFTPGWYLVLGVDVDVPSEVVWLSSKMPPSDARPFSCAAFSFCCSFLRNLTDLNVGRVMIKRKALEACQDSMEYRINWFIRRRLISSFDALSSPKFWWCTIVKPHLISGCFLY